jgi:hypothetical protein
MNTKEEFILRGLIKKQINEEFERTQLNESVEKELKNIFSQFTKTLPKARKEKKEDVQNEALLTAAAIGLALPGIIKLISFFGKKASSVINKAFGNKLDQLKNSENWFHDLMITAEHLHHLYLKPIKYVVNKVFKVQDEQKAFKIANLIFHAIIAVMLVASGIGILKAYQSKHISMGVLEAALSAVKSGELGTFVSSAISKIE